MKQHIVSLPHHPKRVVAISLIIAIIIGVIGYIKINAGSSSLVVKDNGNNNANSTLTNNLTLGFLAGGRIKTVSVKAGDTVKKGQVLATLDAENAQGALAQAEAVYKTAQANYQKIINGATGTAIGVAKAVVNTAEVNLDGTTKQQNLLVSNARANLLNSTITPILINSDGSIPPPIISGTYNNDTEGSATFTINQTGTGGYINFSGIIDTMVPVSITAPQPIADSGLYIQFPSISKYLGTSWKINIPNTTAPNYLANYNSYQSALETKNQAISNAQANLDQANSSLTALVTTARPEDVAVAQAQVDNAAGAVQIAEAAYSNTVITAPSDGTVTSVAIAPGQIATPNASAIQFISSSSN